MSNDTIVEVKKEDILLAKDHPLREMLTEMASGTASHSERIASLAEAVGTAVHLDVPKIRAGALLHDIGKTFNPWLFSENQRTPIEKGFHDSIAPEISAALLAGHVAHTARILSSYPGIPEDVTQWCIQHHGTCIIPYPYARAIKEYGQEAVDAVENVYRYPGPKPASLEAFILMFCDQAEATTRSLSQADKLDSCEKVVNDTWTKLEIDKQIDDVPFIVWQLRTIKEVLTRELESSYHTRVDYDEADKPTEEAPPEAKED